MDKKEVNKVVSKWNKESIAKLQKKFDELNIVHSERSSSAVSAREVLKATLSYSLGLVSKIAFKFPRHMVFVAKGVGNGVPAALAGTDATKRKPKDWFNSVIDPQVEVLADEVAEKQADLIVNKLRIR